MRYLVYTLVFANLAYFAWYQYSPTQKPADFPLASVPAGVNRLLLLSERPVVEPEPPAEPQEAEEVVKEPVEADEQLAAVAVQRESNQTTEQPNENDTVTAGPETEFEAVSVASEPVCHTIGPLIDTGDVTSISKKLSQLGFQSNMRGNNVREPAGYWVYMPAMPRSKARSIVADLDAKGMKDYFIGRENHISLGIFSTEKKARKRLKRVKELGYDAELGQRYRSRALYWLDVEEGDQPLAGSQIWAEIQLKHDDISMQLVSCASPER